MPSVFGVPVVEIAEDVDEGSGESSSSAITPSVKCSPRGGMTMLLSNPGIGGSFDVKPDTRVRRSGT